MTFEQLLYAEVLSRCVSMQKAADTLHITKSALSMAIAQLEAELGFQIFERTKKGCIPTRDGLRILSSAAAILRERNALLSSASDICSSEKTETFSMRYMNTMFPSFVLPFIEHYHEEYTGLKMDIGMAQIETIIAQLNTNTIDAGFVSVTSALDTALSGLTFTPVVHTRIVLGCAKDNPLLLKQTVTPQDLQSQIFCLYNEAFQDHLFESLQFLCGPLKMVLRVDDPWAMHEAITKLNAVCLGRVALGLLSRDRFMNDLCQIDIGHIIDDHASMGWLTNPKYELSPLKKKLIEEISGSIKKNA